MFHSFNPTQFVMNRTSPSPRPALLILLAGALYVGIGQATCEPACTAATGRGVPDFGLMFNNDGDLSFTGATPEESVRNLRLMVATLAGTPVKTLMYSVGSGPMCCNT